MTRGKFITVEGVDGAGKTTHLEYLESLMQQAGVAYCKTREPGGTAIGEHIRELILASDSELSDKTELLLIFAARMEHINAVINPALNAGQWVLCDRFTDATYAYQGGGRGIKPAEISILEQWVQAGLTPDLTFVFDVPIEVGCSRIKARAQATDRFEKQESAFKQAVRTTYLALAQQHPERIKVIDSGVSIARTQGALQQVFSEFVATI